MIIAITVGFAPASQFARGLMEYHFNRSLKPDIHVFVQGHYPINTSKNNRDIKMLIDSYSRISGCEVLFLDPGEDIGSAQSQWYALKHINPPDDAFWINVDSDSACRDRGWDHAAKVVMNENPDCIVVSCNSPLVQKLMEKRTQKFEIKETKYSPEIAWGKVQYPTPFNYSFWRYSFFKSIGGIPQMGARWGEVEGGVFYYSAQQNKFHAYLIDFMEDESGKFMQDKQLVEYKDLHLRTDGPNRFPGFYIEYLKWKYPDLLKVDTFIADGTEFQ